MVTLLINSIALDPNRWTKEKKPYFKLDALLPSIVHAGFHFVEVWQYHVLEEDAPRMQAIRATADSLDIAFPVVGMYPQLHLTDEARRQELTKVTKVLEYAKMLGADNVKIFVGTQSGSSIGETEYLRSVAFMKEILDGAKARDLTVTGETHQKTLFDTIESCQRFLRDVNDDRFKICFQPYDLHDTGKALHDYERVAGDVTHVHYQGRRGDQIDLLENSDFDYRQLTRALAQRSFRGYLCIEFTRDCVVPDPHSFRLDVVLENAKQDRDFVLRAARELALTVRA